MNKYSSINVFKNKSTIYLRKSDYKIVSWITILMVSSMLLITLSVFYKFELFTIYHAKVVKDDQDNYISVLVDNEFLKVKNRNYLEINDKEIKCHLIDVSNNYVIINNLKYWQVNYECELSDEININNNLLEIKIREKKQSLFQYILKKIRKEHENARIKT